MLDTRAPFHSTRSDQPETLLQIIGGGGQYGIITRRCGGDVISADEYTFEEVSVTLDHRQTKHLRIGIRTHFISGVDPFGEGPPGKFNSFVTNPYVHSKARISDFNLVRSSETIHSLPREALRVCHPLPLR